MHPAHQHKYAVVPYTRGQGIEVGGDKLFEHFRFPDGKETQGSLDFVFVCGQQAGAWADLLRPGGYLLTVVAGDLRIQQAGADGLRDVVRERPEKSACVVRYGGFGDSLQASNILPELKRQGYHVTFMTTPNGHEILKLDPHIDAWILQDHDQVPNHELTKHWEHWAQEFDKFVNLSESVEGTLLAYPGRANHAWPDAVRRVELNKNYLEWTSALAELPYHSDARFYPSAAEVDKAKTYIHNLHITLTEHEPNHKMAMSMRLPERFTILWALAGSSIHKFYPHQDTVINRVLAEMPEAAVIFNGDAACVMLEAGWEEHPRVRCESGEMGIRDTLTLAQHVDCVVGPETGVLNAVAFEPVAKVIMLSHSSKRNLTMHWVNTATLEPTVTACYPCHRLHFGRDYCHEEPSTGAAICQANIGPDRAFASIQRAYAAWLAKRDQKVAA